MSSYRQQIGNEKSLRRNSNNIEDRQQFLNTVGEGTPSNSEGFNGQETVRYIKDKGVYHFIKRGGKWHSRLFNDSVQTAQEEVDTTVTVDTSNLEYDNLTVSAGNGLTGGGLVALGGSTTLDANVDGTSLEISSDAIQIKSGGVTESHINQSVAGDGIQGGNGSSLAIDVSDFIGNGLLDDGNENIDVLFDGGYEDFDLSGAEDSLITSGGLTFVVTDESSVSTITPDATAISGVLNEAARSDHTHAITTAPANTIQPDASVSEGVATSFSRSDHTHAITTASANTIQPDASASEGVATSFSRSDHTHAIVTDTPINVDLGVNAEGTSTSFARADHKHDLDESIAPLWTGLHTHNNDIYLYTDKKIYWVDTNQFIKGDATSITIDGDNTVTLEADTKVNLKSNQIDFGTDANVDTTLNFLGGDGGVYRWMEDEDYFKFSDDILIEGDEKFYIYDTNSYLYAASSGTPSVHPKLHIAAASNYPYAFGSGFTDSYRMRLDVSGQVYAMGEADYEANISALTTHDLQSSDYDTGFANSSDSDWA